MPRPGDTPAPLNLLKKAANKRRDVKMQWIPYDEEDMMEAPEEKKPASLKKVWAHALDSCLSSHVMSAYWISLWNVPSEGLVLAVSSVEADTDSDVSYPSDWHFSESGVTELYSVRPWNDHAGYDRPVVEEIRWKEESDRFDHIQDIIDAAIAEDTDPEPVKEGWKW